MEYRVQVPLAIRCRWLLWYIFKNNIVTGQLQYGSVVLRCCFDLQQMGPAAGLEIPWYPHKKQHWSASILHPRSVFIWITPPNPLSNDMTQWVTILQTLLREKHWVFGRERLECSEKREGFKWISEEQNIGMITAHQICISTGSACDSERIILTHLLTANTSLNSADFSDGGFGVVNWFSPKTLQSYSRSITRRLKCFMLTGPWPHRVGIYLELHRESATVQHDPLGNHEHADVSEGEP